MFISMVVLVFFCLGSDVSMCDSCVVSLGGCSVVRCLVCVVVGSLDSLLNSVDSCC